MKRYLIGLVSLALFCFQSASAKENTLSSVYLGSREGDPSSLVENVSTIHGDYTEVEVDLTVPAPDSLILSRFYSSRDAIQTATLGGWRFNPHCFLTIQKDPKGKTYTTSEGKFERFYIYVGNPDGSILTYVGWKNTASMKRILFKIDAEGESAGLANTAKGNINSWTNLKNNELYFDPQTDSFELFLCSEGKRFYAKHPSLDFYFITYEILPSGNKIFYEFDEKGQLSLIKETNASEKKVLAWIKIHYSDGIHIETSDGKTVDYQFQQDPSGTYLLTEVNRSDKPQLHYQYQVVDNHALLVRKTLPEGRFVQIDYYTDQAKKYKVRSVTTPTITSGTAIIQFSYGNDETEVIGPGKRKSVYRFDDDFQLTAIEQYLNASLLYRVHKKSWGKKSDAGNLISTSVEDNEGNIFYHKHFSYDSKNKGNIVEEREYGNLAGAGAIPLIIDENGLVANQKGHIKNFSYFSGKDTQVFFQMDAKGKGVKYWYKKGTNLLLKKFILTSGSPDAENEDYRSGIIERHFYTYNDDAVLIRVVVDDGEDGDPRDYSRATERLITHISPKQELPNIGAPEIVEQKYSSSGGQSELLLKKTINQFDGQGNIISQSVHDANDVFCYSVTKGYSQGLLVFETDPLGNEAHYSYDANHNLISEAHSDTGISIEYGYDLRNRPIYTAQKDRNGNRFETQVFYDPAGNKQAEVDPFGNKTLYINDALGRPITITYPEVSDGPHISITPSYTFTYDLFDNQISVTDIRGRVLSKSYTVHGKPIQINHLDGTKEVFRYDNGGNLHHYYGRDGLIQVFEYDDDDRGRLTQIEYFERKSKDLEFSFKKKAYGYNAFHKTFEYDEHGNKTTYTYDGAGRLATLNKDNRKVEFIYDSLGRTHGVKKWKSSNAFTLEVKEYDFLDRVIEERTEDTAGRVLVRKKYVYNDAGKLAQVIGYPQNKESVLMQYEYDGFVRLCKTSNAAGHANTIIYDDAYICAWGQKAKKRTLIDPLGNQTEEIFDNDDNLIKATKKDKSGQFLAESQSPHESGNKRLEWDEVISAGEFLWQYETRRFFNQKDQLVSITFGTRTPKERIIRFEYNSYGDLAAKYNHASKEPISYQYDSYGNLETISYKEGKNEFCYKLSYDSNKKNLTGVSLNSSFAINYTYDAHDLPLVETIKDEFGSYQVSRTYDGEGKIQTLKLPDGSFVEYTYEGPFVKSATRFSKEKKELYNYQVALRDQMGNILEEILPGHLGGRRQVWDEASRRIEIATDFFQDKVPQGGYDPLENIKKRETALGEEKYTIDYDYNALAQLIAEKGKIEHHYSYDSIGNRLKKDGSIYRINESNQLVKAEGASYTFDPNGNLATKTIGSKTWTYQSNPLNQIISIKDPDQNTVKFTYDLSGKRLTKCIETKGRKAKIFRFFYLGNTEIGCIDEKGIITELKIPSDPNNPEAPSIAIEIKKETYVPLYDLQGNIICLLDHLRHKIVESYHYSVYGEEKITNEKGKVVSDSSLGNPWRYRGKRVDKVVGLIYFGYRYYDPEVGRWISPDPLGTIDGPNLYAYASNNPMTYIDYFGLVSDINENQNCVCGHCVRNEGFCHCLAGIDFPACVCKGILCSHKIAWNTRAGTNITSALGGISHGVVDFVIGSLHDLQTVAVYIGARELELSLQERNERIEAVERSQANQMAKVESWMMDKLSIDQSDAAYQSFRSKTTMGLEVGSLVAGGYGAIKGVMAFNRLAKVPSKISKFGRLIQGIRTESSASSSLSSLRLKNRLISQEISAGHAFGKHILNQGEFPGWIRTRAQFAQHIENVINNPSGIRELRNGRVAFWHQETGTIVIRNPSALDGGTAFQPIEGINYFETRLR